MIEVLLLLIQNLKKSMDDWKGSWTSNRANKLDRLDNLDKSLSGVESTIGRKIDNLVTASQGNNPNLALSNLTNKIDALKQDVGTKSSQTTVNKVGQDLNNLASTITNKIGGVENKVNQTNTTLASMDNIVSNIALDVVESKTHAKGAYNIVSKGVIKRVQSGTIRSCDIWNSLVERSYGSGNLKLDVYSYTANMPFSVQTNKCLVICNITQVNYDRLVSSHVVGYLSSASQLTFEFVKAGDFVNNIKQFVLSWQVIEYY